jgi:hypothetical protein
MQLNAVNTCQGMILDLRETYGSLANHTAVPGERGGQISQAINLDEFVE